MISAHILLTLLAPALQGDGPLRPIPFHEVRVTDPFWSQRIATNRTATVRACLEQCEKTQRIRNLAIAGGLAEGEYEGYRFNDSDVYKVIEGAAYALHSGRDAELEKHVDAIIDVIAAAQQTDGYVNSYYTLVKPQAKWKDIAHGHELYCAGHMIEAAIAYQRATGKRKLLDVAIRFADLIDREFGPGRRLDPPGHQELELALFKLADATGDERYEKLGLFFLEQRGNSVGRKLFGAYSQDHLPVREQTEAVGHAVRSMYLYCGMADAVSRTGDPGMKRAIETVFDSIEHGKMYLTGGIGSLASNEGFSKAWELPNDTAYAETCAAIGMALWSHRLYLMTGEMRYGDVFERVLYNGLLSGVSLSGDRFFYTNPLASKGQHQRVPWFRCACCPSNIVRYVPGIGERIYAHAGDRLSVLLPVGSQTTVPLASGRVGIEIVGRYPWQESVEIRLAPEQPFRFELRLRIPSWCDARPEVAVNGEPCPEKPSQGFLSLTRQWKGGDVVKLRLPMTIRRVYSDPRVESNRGRVALQRGPVVYCFEGVDHGGHARDLVLPKDAVLEASWQSETLAGVMVIRGRGERVRSHGHGPEEVELTAIPYYTWNNRGPNEMVVWIAEDPAVAELPGDAEVVVHRGVRIRASHCWDSDTVEALNDARIPAGSGDHGLPRMTWWSKRGTTEWVEYEFDTERRLSWSQVYWFDDRPGGGCRTPASWRLLSEQGGEWQPVALKRGSSYDLQRDRFNHVEFDGLRTRRLRLEVQLRAGFSGGVLEWRVGG